MAPNERAAAGAGQGAGGVRGLPRPDGCEAQINRLIARLDVAGCRDFGYALKGVLELHRKVALRRYEEGFEAGARAHGEVMATELVVKIYEAGERMQLVASRLEALMREGKTP